ncbi:hypothetical protein MYCOZU2_01968 [Mycobacterium intracellulare subsp. chimaera]|uniref:Uncharacterized protein n=1 Tax=Mycobacterium intracellulare subsp. chimaera TaxID=222805 RepID=A0A7U5RUK9_MYCIT|nr:hypothetical protein MYCOZU2_01968 [Mycobacterium intracellulare subsp. chimaera]
MRMSDNRMPGQQLSVLRICRTRDTDAAVMADPRTEAACASVMRVPTTKTATANASASSVSFCDTAKRSITEGHSIAGT